MTHAGNGLAVLLENVGGTNALIDYMIETI